jgi:hypothetical protein
MNEYEIENAEHVFRDHPVLGPAVRTLRNLVDWTNRNSDGWAYWPKPTRAAEKLMELIEGPRGNGADPVRDDATVEKLKAALRPIKAFRTRHAGGDGFEIIESLDQVEISRTYHFHFEVEAATAQDAIDKLEELIAVEGLGAALNVTCRESERVAA